jgi:hypothetical protein
MAVANTLAFYVTTTLTAVKSFIVEAEGGHIIKHFSLVLVLWKINIKNIRLG